MINFDHQLLVDIGLGHLNQRQQAAILRRLSEVLEMRVGLLISESLTRQQHEIFERLIENDDDASAETFLEENIPDYKAVVRREFEWLLGTLASRVRATDLQDPSASAP